MRDCTGEEICREWLYHIGVPTEKINALALEANKKRYEAYKLEQEALEIMDKEVIYAK